MDSDGHYIACHERPALVEPFDHGNGDGNGIGILAFKSDARDDERTIAIREGIRRRGESHLGVSVEVQMLLRLMICDGLLVPNVSRKAVAHPPLPGQPCRQ